MSSRTKRMSTPSSRSGLSGEAPASAGWTRTGRRLAKSPSARRMPRSPCSGRVLAADHPTSGPPTAPSRTASAARHASRVARGSGSPVGVDGDAADEVLREGEVVAECVSATALEDEPPFRAPPRGRCRPPAEQVTRPLLSRSGLHPPHPPNGELRSPCPPPVVLQVHRRTRSRARARTRCRPPAPCHDASRMLGDAPTVRPPPLAVAALDEDAGHRRRPRGRRRGCGPCSPRAGSWRSPGTPPASAFRSAASSALTGPLPSAAVCTARRDRGS